VAPGKDAEFIAHGYGFPYRKSSALFDTPFATMFPCAISPLLNHVKLGPAVKGAV